MTNEEFNKALMDLNNNTTLTSIANAETNTVTQTSIKKAINQIKATERKKPYLICKKEDLPKVEFILRQHIPEKYWKPTLAFPGIVFEFCLRDYFDIKISDYAIKPMILKKGWYCMKTFKPKPEQMIMLDI